MICLWKMHNLTFLILTVLGVVSWKLDGVSCSGERENAKLRELGSRTNSQLAPVPGSFRSQSWKNKPFWNSRGVNKTLVDRYFIQQELARRRAASLRYGLIRGVNFHTRESSSDPDAPSFRRKQVLPGNKRLPGVLPIGKDSRNDRRYVDTVNQRFGISGKTFNKGSTFQAQNERIGQYPKQGILGFRNIGASSVSSETLLPRRQQSSKSGRTSEENNFFGVPGRGVIRGQQVNSQARRILNPQNGFVGSSFNPRGRQSARQTGVSGRFNQGLIRSSGNPSISASKVAAENPALRARGRYGADVSRSGSASRQEAQYAPLSGSNIRSIVQGAFPRKPINVRLSGPQYSQGLLSNNRQPNPASPLQFPKKQGGIPIAGSQYPSRTAPNRRGSPFGVPLNQGAQNQGGFPLRRVPFPGALGRSSLLTRGQFPGRRNPPNGFAVQNERNRGIVRPGGAQYPLSLSSIDRRVPFGRLQTQGRAPIRGAQYLPQRSPFNRKNPLGGVPGPQLPNLGSFPSRRNPFPGPPFQNPSQPRGSGRGFPLTQGAAGGISGRPFPNRGGLSGNPVDTRQGFRGFPPRPGLPPRSGFQPQRWQQNIRGGNPSGYPAGGVNARWRQPQPQGFSSRERPLPAQRFQNPSPRQNPGSGPIENPQWPPQNTIFNSLVYNRHSIFLRYLQNVSLIGMLQVGGPYTVFAPSDEAFLKVNEKLAEILADKEKRWILISNHIVPGRFYSSTFKDGQILTSSIGDKVYVNVAKDATKERNNVWIHGSQVSGYDAPASNGVVHRIDDVIVPAFTTLRDHLKKSKDHTIIAKALLETTQYIPPTLTLLAPLDSAFEYLQKEYKERLLKSNTLMRRLLSYHIIPKSLCRGRLFNRLGLSNTSSLLGPDYPLDLYKDPFLKDTNFVNNGGILSDTPVYEGWLLSLSEVLLPDHKLTVDILAEELQVSQFVTLLKKSGISELLKMPYNTYTLFAPTNRAYRSLNYNQKRLLRTNQTYLKYAMQYHFTKVKILSSKLGPVETFDSGLISVRPPSMGVRIVTNKIHDDFIVQGARAESADNMAKNGIVHVIDKFLLPPTKTLYDIITTDTRLTYLKRTFQRSGFLPQLRGNSQFTIFAPSDHAFVNLLYYKRNFFRSSRKTFQDFLFQHMCRGVIFTRALKNRKSLLLRTLKRDVNQRIEKSGPYPEHLEIRKFSARGTRLDIVATNGIIHVIDKVLIYEYLGKQMRSH